MFSSNLRDRIVLIQNYLLNEKSTIFIFRAVQQDRGPNVPNIEYHDVLCIVHFTLSMKGLMLPDQQSIHHHDIVARVFKQELKS